jgi:hypothetical protein
VQEQQDGSSTSTSVQEQQDGSSTSTSVQERQDPAENGGCSSTMVVPVAADVWTATEKTFVHETIEDTSSADEQQRLSPEAPTAHTSSSSSSSSVVANFMRPHWRTVEEMKDAEPAENGGWTRKCIDFMFIVCAQSVRTRTLCCSLRVRSQRKCTLC